MLFGGRVLDPSQGAGGLDGEADVVVERGVIARLGRGAGDGIAGESVRRIDCRGRWVVPGFVDLHVHFRHGWMSPAT